MNMLRIICRDVDSNEYIYICILLPHNCLSLALHHFFQLVSVVCSNVLVVASPACRAGYVQHVQCQSLVYSVWCA